ncbi:transcriptional regulatory protein GAL4 [Leptodontidium sp. MPI-SDFR-AT-0119]|nr:transcriptional regulatory protein GAL4 [Leptodontidium sp. MPI-SDFR-AT-0119]
MSLASKPTDTNTVKSAQPSSNAGQPCRECRRRKGKCDCKVPVCSVCQRYNRHCLYDKHSQSSLTRKHLTEVEERLERAEALLRTFIRDAQQSQKPVHVVSNGVDVALGHSRSHLLASDATVHQQNLTNASSTTGAEYEWKFDTGLPESSTLSSPNATGNGPLSFENFPYGNDDFEWDERNYSWTLPDADIKNSVLNANMEGDVSKTTDGMATLTVDDSNTGFLGSVSGAALLRLIWMGTGSHGAGETPDGRDECQESLEQFFRHRSSDGPSLAPWLRTQAIVTRAMADTFIDAYFALYHPTFPILHESTFREQYSKVSDRPGGSTWLVLANLVAALGSFVSSTCSDDTHTTFFNAVKGHLSIESLETGSLTLVQAFGMAANYLQKRNRPNSGYNYGGVALRLAISLGLHKELHGWRTAPLKKEIRRRVWWSLCVLDVGATVTYGRPLNWPQAGVETAFPLNIHEKDLTTASTSLPPEANETTIYSYIRTQSSYHLRTMRIYNRLISSPLPSATDLLSLDDELIEGWRSSLPHYFRDNDLPLSNEYLLGHSISRWRFRLLRIIMYRPFLIRWAQNDYGLSTPSSPSTQEYPQFSTAENTATMRCFQAAEECISALFCFWTSGTHTRLAAWYVLYFLLQASLIPIHCLRHNPSHPDSASWRSQILTSLNIINAMKEINPSAPKCRDVIHRLCGRSLHSSVSQSRQEQASFPQKQGQDSTFPNLFSFPPTTSEGSDSGMDSWMTEIDTAIDGYDVYCDRLGNTAVDGMGGMGNGEGNGNDVAGGITDWATPIGMGVQDWSWGLMI